MIYLWIEDKNSGLDFWEHLCEILYGNKIKVETKENAGNLVKSVEKLIEKDVSNSYYILFDNVADNPMSIQHLNKLRSFARKQANIILIEEYISLEASLLSFSNLLTYLAKQKKLSSLTIDIAARQALLNSISFNNDTDYSFTNEILNYCTKYGTKKKYTIESIASSILKNLTKDSGFELTKSMVGNCWLEPCCAEDKYLNCNDKVDSKKKAETLIHNSLLKKVIDKVVV